MAIGERLAKVADGTRWMARAGKFAPVFFHALIGRKLDLIAAALKLLRQGGGGKQMPARAARGEKDRARAHAALLPACAPSRREPGCPRCA